MPSRCDLRFRSLHDTDKNLHWVIRAQIAKRGGHRSHVRIAPEAVPGYISALRETNSGGDGKGFSNPSRIWKPKGIGSAAEHRVGENVSPLLNPAVGEIPHDFSNIGYTALEIKLNQLAHGTDEWADQVAPAHLIPWNDRYA